MKYCPNCKEQCPLENFNSNKSRKDGLGDWCRPCVNLKAKTYRSKPKALANSKAYYEKNRDKQLARMVHTSRLLRTGCTPELYAALLYAQGARCGVCMEPSYGKALQADHDHDTMRIRGLLCGSCNRAEGLIKGNAWSLARYLNQVN